MVTILLKFECLFEEPEHYGFSKSGKLDPMVEAIRLVNPGLESTSARNGLLNRVCYDASNQYMLIALRSTYYHYCGIDSGTVSELMAASSMGRFFNLGTSPYSG